METLVNDTPAGQPRRCAEATGSALYASIREKHAEAQKSRAKAWAEMMGDTPKTLEDPARTYAYWEGVCDGLIAAASLCRPSLQNDRDVPTSGTNGEPKP